MSEASTVGVTGAAGYIGSRVVSDLLDAGHDVVAVDNFYASKIDSIGDTTILDVDVRDRSTLREALSGVDTIMHLAGITGVQECADNPELSFDVNVVGTENVAWLCGEWGTPLVFPASMAVIGDPVDLPIDASHPRHPLNRYGRTKAMSEQDIGWLAEGRYPALVLMKSNLYGHHSVDGQPIGKRTVINVFVERALAGEPLTVHEPGTQTRDFVHVKDISKAYLLALEYFLGAEDGRETIPIASGECLSVIEVAELVGRIVREELGEAIEISMSENPRDTDETVTTDFSVDVEDAQQTLGFEATHSVEESIREWVSESRA